MVQLLSPAAAKTWTGEEQAAAINSAMLALLDAGSIPLRGVICAVCDPKSEDGCWAYLFTSNSGSDLASGRNDEDDEEPKPPPSMLIYATSGKMKAGSDDEDARKLATEMWIKIWRAKAGLEEPHLQNDEDEMLID